MVHALILLILKEFSTFIKEKIDFAILDERYMQLCIELETLRAQYNALLKENKALLAQINEFRGRDIQLQSSLEFFDDMFFNQLADYRKIIILQSIVIGVLILSLVLVTIFLVIYLR